MPLKTGDYSADHLVMWMRSEKKTFGNNRSRLVHAVLDVADWGVAMWKVIELQDRL